MDETVDYENPDEWELINEEGYVYRRRKRLRLDPTTSSSSAAPPPDPALEKKHRQERKKRALLKLRERYAREISQWELISNTLQAMDQWNPQLQSTEMDAEASSSCRASSSQEHLGSNSTCGGLVDDLLSQVEAQEAVIKDVSNLCDVAEELCNAEEERLKKQFIDLPIWEPSPSELMSALCDR